MPLDILPQEYETLKNQLTDQSQSFKEHLNNFIKEDLKELSFLRK